MQDALPIVIVAVVVAAGLVGRRGGAAEPRRRMTASAAPDLTFDGVDSRVNEDSSREAEEMLAASNARRAAKGRPRRRARRFESATRRSRPRCAAFVVARNERLIARGKPPLDVEAEVERRLSGQDG